jgi:hypothetical protein
MIEAMVMIMVEVMEEILVIEAAVVSNDTISFKI